MPAPSNRPWADKPFELIPSSTLGYKPGEKVAPIHETAEEMIIIHNVLLRGINSIYLQCVNVQKAPKPAKGPSVTENFTHYALQWGETIEEHHHIEETVLFPAFAEAVGEPELMTAEVGQHKAFHDGLDGYIAYLKAVVAGEQEYDGLKLRGMIDAFMPILRQHLMDEIVTLKGFERFEGEKKEKLIKTAKKLAAQIKEDAQKKSETKTTVLPFVLQNQDMTFDDGVYSHWPGVPWFARLIISWFLVPKNKGWWVFTPCDPNMKPRELPYVD